MLTEDGHPHSDLRGFNDCANSAHQTHNNALTRIHIHGNVDTARQADPSGKA